MHKLQECCTVVVLHSFWTHSITKLCFIVAQIGSVKNIETVYIMKYLITNVKYTCLLNWILPLAKGTKWQNIGQVLLGILEEGWSLFNTTAVRNSSRVQACRWVYPAMIWYLEFSLEGENWKELVVCFDLIVFLKQEGWWDYFITTTSPRTLQLLLSMFPWKGKCLIHNSSLKYPHGYD